MAKYTTEVSNTATGREIWVIEEDDRATRRLAYRFNIRQNNISFYPKPGEFELSEIILEGFYKITRRFFRKWIY